MSTRILFAVAAAVSKKSRSRCNASTALRDRSKSSFMRLGLHRHPPLVDRLKECQQRIGNMCAELRGPKMSIPVEYYDDDFYICTTLADAQATVEALQALVRALPVVRIDLNGAYHDTLLAQPEDEAVKELLRYRAGLDATTPDSNQLGDINDMVSKGGDGE